MINVLSFTTLYPSAAKPVHGIFVENRLRRLAETRQVVLSIVAPVPWFPSRSRLFGRYAAWAAASRREIRHGIEVFRPRYPVIPKLRTAMAPSLMYLATRGLVRRLVHEGRIDLIDVHYFYPDGVAAVRLAKDVGLPVCVTARGGDLNLAPQFPGPRRQIERAARRADALITVCDALQGPLLNMGIDPARITTVRNGVDRDLFRPLDRAEARRRWAVTGQTIVSVGLLIKRKAHHLIVEALKSLPDMRLLIAGDGMERRRLERQIAGAGLSDRVRLLGGVAHEDLPSLFNAADAVVLASSREGLLEAMSCGTPVVATDVWGTAEAVTSPQAGILIREQSATAIAEGLRTLFANLPDRAATPAHAERFSWNTTTQGHLEVFRRIIGFRTEPVHAVGRTGR